MGGTRSSASNDESPTSVSIGRSDDVAMTRRRRPYNASPPYVSISQKGRKCGVVKFTFGGRFAMSTMRVCSTAFEKRGPTGVQSARHIQWGSI